MFLHQRCLKHRKPWWWWFWSWWWLWWCWQWCRLGQHSLELFYKMTFLMLSWSCWCRDKPMLILWQKCEFCSLIIDQSAVQAILFVPSPLMQCTFVQVNSHATTSMYERVSVWHQAYLLCPGVDPLCRRVSVTHNFLGPILPFWCIFVQAVFDATTSGYERVMSDIALLLCPDVVHCHPLCRRVSVFYCRAPSHAFSLLVLLLSSWAWLIFSCLSLLAGAFKQCAILQCNFAVSFCSVVQCCEVHH